MTVRGHQLAIDWSQRGTYAGTLEDVSSYVTGDIEISWGRNVEGEVTLASTSGSMTFELTNDSRAFSQENVGSPIAANILPGRAVRYQATMTGGSGTLSSQSWSTAGTSGWTAPDGGTLTRVASPSEDGNGAAQFVPPGAVATTSIRDISRRLQAWAPHTVSFRVLSSAGWSDVGAVIDWSDATGAYVSTSGLGSPTTCPAGVWTTVASAPLTPPANAVTMVPRLRIGSTPVSSNTFTIDSAQVTWAYPTDGQTYTLLQGVLDEIADEGDRIATFTGTALDGWGRPGAERLSTPLYRGLRTGDAIGLVLDAIGWTGSREIDAGATVMPWWWAEGDDAATAITKIVHSEGAPAIAYVRGGTFVFKDRHHRLTSSRSTTSQGIYTHIIPASTGPGGDFKIEAGSFSYNHGLGQIVNSATFAVDVRTLQPLAEVWTSEDPVSIAAGTSAQFTIQADSAPFIGAIVPSVAEGDIVLQSGAVSGVTLSRTSGQSAILTITCSGDTVITRLALRAYAAAVSRTVQVNARDQGSIGRFGTKEWPSEAAPSWAGPYDAQAIASRVVTLYATYRPTLTFTVVALDVNYLAEILDARVSDRITVRNDQRGINSDFMIERLSHRITKLGIMHRLTITCQAIEPTQPTTPLTFDVAGRGFNDGRFSVDGIDNAGSMLRFDVAGQGFNQGVFAN